MIGSLLDSIEADYGVFSTRLYRAFRPKPGTVPFINDVFSSSFTLPCVYAVKPTASWKFRKLCCIPYAVIFLVCVDILIAGLAILALHETEKVNNRIM